MPWTVLMNTALFIAQEFAPDDSTTGLETWQISDAIEATFTSRPSGIYVAGPGTVSQTQLTCKEVRLSLLSEPLFVAAGEWQVYAATMQGVQVWSIYEPGLSIVPLGQNTSAC